MSASAVTPASNCFESSPKRSRSPGKFPLEKLDLVLSKFG